MTVETTTNKARFVGNAAATTWPFTFQIPVVTDLQLYYTDLAGVTTLIALADYSVTGIGSVDGGVVTYPLTGSPIASGTILTILRVVPYTQNVDLVNQDGFYPQVLEDGLDALEMQMQQLVEVQGRNLTVGVSDTSPGTLPSAAARASQLLGFDASGNAVAAQPSAALVSTAMQPVVNAATIATAVALMGLAPIPSGLECDFAGLVAPSGWYLEYGQAVARSGDAALLAAIAPSLACTITSGSANVTGLASTAGFYLGMPLESAGFPAGTTVSSALASTSFIASQAATANAAVLQAFPFGNGDGSTTFNLPDGRGLVYAGRDNMGGTAASRLTTAAFGDATQLGKTAGAQTEVIAQANLPVVTLATAIASGQGSHTHTVLVSSGQQAIYGGGTGSPLAGSSVSGAATLPAMTGTTPLGGSATPLETVQPTSIRNKIIKR